MTREEALKKAINIVAYFEAHFAKSKEAREDAANIIEALEQEPCEDAIRRQAVLETLDDMDNALDEDRTVENYKELLKECYEVLPSVNPQEPNTYTWSIKDVADTLVKHGLIVEQEPKTGHWINIEDRTDWYDAAYNCSCCGRAIITPYELKNNLYSDYPYCHCGAKMVEE